MAAFHSVQKKLDSYIAMCAETEAKFKELEVKHSKTMSPISHQDNPLII